MEVQGNVFSPAGMHLGDLGNSANSALSREDSNLLDVQGLGHMLQGRLSLSGLTGSADAQTGVLPLKGLYKDNSGVSNASEDSDVSTGSDLSCSSVGRFFPDVRDAQLGVQFPGICARLPGFAVESSEPSLSPLQEDLDRPLAAAVPSFAGFVEAPFSTPQKRFFCSQSQNKRVGSGTHAVVQQVFWLNPATGQLEPYVTKALTIGMAAEHPDGLAGWRADVSNEVNALCKLAGVAGVVRIMDVIPEGNGAVHIILERVQAIPLTTRITDRHNDGVGLTWPQIPVLLKDTAKVLADCHRLGVVHGDLKPDNMMTSVDTTRMTLVDFGSASVFDGAGWDCQGGALSYTAPELIASARSKLHTAAPLCRADCGPPTDCWSLGVTALELLSGYCLFQPSESAKPAGIAVGSEQWTAWYTQCIADLHADWEDASESHPIHATFREKLEHLAGVSAEYHREAVSFLRALLEPDQSRRLTAEGALEHRFLNTAFLDISPDNMLPEREALVFATARDRKQYERFLRVVEKGGHVDDMDDDDDDDDEDESEDEDEDVVMLH